MFQGQRESPLCELMPTYQNTHLCFAFAAESKQQVLSTHTFSKIILVKRFFRFWWKFSGNRARMSSAPVKPQNTTCRVRLCRADTSCGKEEVKRLGRAQQHHGGLSLLSQQPRGVPRALSYLRGLLGAGGDGGAGALRQRAEAAGRAGEALLAQLPYCVLRRRLSGNKAGGAEQRPGRRQPPIPRRAEHRVPSPSAGSAGRRSLPRASPPPS